MTCAIMCTSSNTRSPASRAVSRWSRRTSTSAAAISSHAAISTASGRRPEGRAALTPAARLARSNGDQHPPVLLDDRIHEELQWIGLVELLTVDEVELETVPRADQDFALALELHVAGRARRPR